MPAAYGDFALEPASRVAEALRRATASGAAPLRRPPPHLAAKPVGTFPLGYKLPMYGDAIAHHAVQQCLHTALLPRLDGLSERLASLVAAAHGELRSLQCDHERLETRLEGRLTELEARITLLVDASARSEERERELNTRLAGLAENMLREAQAGQPTDTAGWVVAPDHRCVCEGRLEEMEVEMRHSAREMRWLQENVESLIEERCQCPEIGAELERRVEEQLDLQAATLDQLAAELDERLCQLERHLPSIGAAAEELGDLRGRATSAEAELEFLRVDIERRSRDQLQQVAELSKQVGLRAEVERLASRTDSSPSSAQLNDLSLRLAAMKVKVDAVEGRVSTVAERAEAERKRLEADLDVRVDDRCNWLARRLEPRVVLLEQGSKALRDACDEVLDRRLAKPPGRTCTGSSSLLSRLTPVPESISDVDEL